MISFITSGTAVMEFCASVNALGSIFERRNSGIPQQEGKKNVRLEDSS
jgi:hypothetical protein